MMLSKKMFPVISLLLLLISIIGFGQPFYAETPEVLDGSGAVKVVGSERSYLMDPENPEKSVDPGESPYTTGPLRIDFVSALNFGRAETKKSDRKYSAWAQQFYDETEPRGNYIQITDQREVSTGWSLQVKQQTQFRNPVIQNREEQELVGAYLSLDKGWAKSSNTSQAPTVTRETIALNAMDTAYEVAIASKGGGKGAWTIAFGASKNNSDNQGSTLEPLLDKKGKAVVDEVYQKPAYTNSAVTLTVPETTKIYPVQYETKLTWILAELP